MLHNQNRQGKSLRQGRQKFLESIKPARGGCDRDEIKGNLRQQKFGMKVLLFNLNGSC